MALHTVSLCTGIGGIERGLELAAPGAFKPVLYVEREISAAAIIAAEIERGRLRAAPIWSDVKTLSCGSVARYLDQVGVDVITGGYPCQPFSFAGKRRGADDPRHLWPSIAQAIERFTPSLCFFENVAGHLVCGFEEVGDDLERLGYRVAAGLFTASEVGASHKRERLFILAVSNRERFSRWAESDGEQDQSEQQTQRRRDADGCGVELAERNRDRSSAGLSGSQSGKEGHAGIVVDCGAVVGDSAMPDDTRHEVRQTEGEPRGADSFPDLSINPVFAPGRNHEWSTIRSDLHPATESPFCGLVDGISRADELRALGNAVVPHCSAVAFLSLWACLNH